MTRRIVLAFVLLMTIVLLVHNIPLASYLSKVERDRLITALERDAFILAGHAKESLTDGASPRPSMQPYVDEYAKKSSALVVVTDGTGLAVSSNDPSVYIGTDYSNRPEIARALAGVPVSGDRPSQTLKSTLVYVAVPVLSGDDIIGAVRISYPKSVVDHRVRDRQLGILVVGLITLAASVIAAALVAYTLVRPVRRLTRATEELSAGDMAARAPDDEGPPEIRELSRSFNSMVGRLDSVLSLQRAFAGEVSHQLRTPLTALRLRLEQAESLVGRDDIVVREALDASREETDRLQLMIEQLLALSRLEGGTAITVEVDAVKVARERAAMWGPLAEERQVAVQVQGDAHARCKVVDGGLEQMIDNFVDNALSVAPSNSSVVIDVRRSGAHVVVDVVDEGPGLTDQERLAAFQRFWRGRGVQNDGGSGLGLAIVRQIAAASGGSAELLANEPRGIRARVTLLLVD